MGTKPLTERAPAVLEHARTIWFMMYERSKPETEHGQSIMVYEGALTRLFSESHLSTPYYTSVMRLLNAMDCVRQIRRGGGGQPSRWLMVQEPTTELFIAIQGRQALIRSKSATSKDGMMQMIHDLNRRLIQVEEEYATHIRLHMGGSDKMPPLQEAG